MKHLQKIFLFSILIVFNSNCTIWDLSQIKDDYFLKILTLLFRDGSHLQITSIIPKNGSTNNYRNTNIFIGFNKNPPILNSSQITIKSIKDGSIPEEGILSQTGKFIVFTPSTLLAANTTFTISISAENVINADSSYTFSTGIETDTTPPSIQSTSPDAGETNFPPNGTIIANFSEPIDPTSISYFSISSNPSGTLSLTDQTMAFSPSPNLAFLTPYVVVIRSGVKDLAGNSMKNPYSWVFSTSDILTSTCIFEIDLFNSCLLN